ncbi:MAG TPA: hypothetical protein VME45_10175 [Stellaceae bacterium]|nr:hypothetical protein [Stellaceae bacterium]
MQPRILVAAALLALAGCDLVHKPSGDGPQWVDRPAQDLIDANGKPDRVVRLPPPSLSTVLLYLGGAEPGFAVCERDYFVRGHTIVGYSEHGTDPKCDRRAGNLS